MTGDEAEIPSYHFAARLETRQNVLYERCGNGKADADEAFRKVGGENGAVDSDEFTFCVDERSARIAQIDRRVGLNEILVDVEPEAVTSESGNDARRDGLSHAKGVSDGEDRLPDLKFRVLCQTNWRECSLGGGYAQKSQVRFRICPYEARLPVSFGAGGCHEEILDAFDDMVIGEHESLFVQNDAASERLHVEFRCVVPVRTDFNAALGTQRTPSQNGHDGGRSPSDGHGEVGRGGSRRLGRVRRQPLEDEEEGETDGDGLGEE